MQAAIHEQVEQRHMEFIRIGTEPDDIESIRQRCTLVKRISPEIYDNFQLRWGDRITNAGIRAVNDEYGPVRGMFMQDGRFLSADDVANMRRVVVILLNTSSADCRHPDYSSELP